MAMQKKFLLWLKRRWLKNRSVVAEYQLRSSARMPVVPTGFGLSLGFVLLILFIWSVNHRLNLGYAVVFLMATIALISCAFTVGILSRLRVQAGHPEPVWAGEMAWFPVSFQEEEGYPRPGLWLSNDYERVWCAGIDRNTQEQVLLGQPAFQRGWQEMLPIQIHSSLPLGIFVCWQWVMLDSKVLVYPAPGGNLPLPLSPSPGRGQSPLSGKGEDELSGLTPYRQGDPLSRVAWKQSGRGERMLKQFSSEGAQEVVLDFARAAGDVEQRLSQLAQWIIDCERAGYRYQLRLPNHKDSLFGSGHYHRDRCLQALAEF